MYSIYFGNTLFPVAPEKIELKIKNQNEQLSLINEGELSILKSPGLSEYSLTLLLPAKKYHFAQYTDGKFRSPAYYLSVLEKLKTERTVFDFSVLQNAKDKKKYICMKVSLEEYEISESAEDYGDMYATISLKQYVHYGTKVIKIKNGSAAGSSTSRPGGNPPKGKKYTIREPDTLPSISKKFYGTQNRYMEIYKANKKLLDSVAVKRGFPAESGHWWIFAGTVITIP